MFLWEPLRAEIAAEFGARGGAPASLGLTGNEPFDLAPYEQGAWTVRVSTSTGVEFDARVRIDTPNEWDYFRHGGILHFVLRQLRTS